jgi:hypothetical protein
MHPHLDLAEQLVHIFGIPGLLAGLVWFVRTYDKGSRALKDVVEDTTETRRMVLETLGGVGEIKSNHLAHIQKEIENQTPLLTSMDKNLTVIATRLEH